MMQTVATGRAGWTEDEQRLCLTGNHFYQKKSAQYAVDHLAGVKSGSGTGIGCCTAPSAAGGSESCCLKTSELSVQ